MNRFSLGKKVARAPTRSAGRPPHEGASLVGVFADGSVLQTPIIAGNKLCRSLITAHAGAQGAESAVLFAPEGAYVISQGRDSIMQLLATSTRLRFRCNP
jgi:hypothetical protein